MNDEARVIPRRLEGPAVYEFIRQRMRGAQTLGSWLLRSLDLASGLIWTYLPSDATDEIVVSFDTSWSIGTRCIMEETDDEPWEDEEGAVIAVLQDFLEGGENRYFILNDPLTQPNETEENEPFFLHGDEVYVFASGEDFAADDECIDWLISLVPGRDPWGIASSLPTGHRRIEQGMQVTGDELRMLAQRTEMMYFNAYDWDSPIIWAKRPWGIGIEPYRRPYASSRPPRYQMRSILHELPDDGVYGE